MIKCINLKNPEKFRMFPDHLANNAKFLKDHGWMIAPSIDSGNNNSCDSPICSYDSNSCCNDSISILDSPEDQIMQEPLKIKRKYNSYKTKNKTTN